MSREYDDPWVHTLSGPWTAKMEREQKPCHYCGNLAAMTEPGKPWKAHKVCALGTPSTGPLGSWDGQDSSPAKDGPYGCGDENSPIVQGRQCGSAGTQNACALCPRSPTYWRTA